MLKVRRNADNFSDNISGNTTNLLGNPTNLSGKPKKAFWYRSEVCGKILVAHRVECFVRQKNTPREREREKERNLLQS